jgi:hypothetical protein
LGGLTSATGSKLKQAGIGGKDTSIYQVVHTAAPLPQTLVEASNLSRR